MASEAGYGFYTPCRVRLAHARRRKVRGPCRVALFSQIRDCANVVESFVRHYASLGFVHLLLYLDDPDDSAAEVLRSSGWVRTGFVELVAVDADLRSQWPSLPSWGRVGQYANMEVQSRQILNNEHALRRARELRVDWLLHVDSDELLCLPSPAPRFFGDLTARGCTMYTFCNVEGVPETVDCPDVLRSVRVFRQNMGLVPRNPAAGMAFFQWQLRLGGWFISYENGKTAVSVNHAVKCLSVCMWEARPQLEDGKGKEPDGSTCTWFTNNDHLWQAAVNRRKEGRLSEEEEVPRLDKCRGAQLLHFCVCDFASFWRKRWTQLGYLSASDQFRVRTSSGAMMARFYRLQCQKRQREARELFRTMCVRPYEVLASDVELGILLTASVGPWPASPSQVPYLELARAAQERQRHFDAWLLYGRACEEAPHAELLRLRVQAALACGLETCAVESSGGEAEEIPKKGNELQSGPMPTPAELQQAVARAVRPEGPQSRLYGALLAVAMGWWHEVNGDEQLFSNALGRAAVVARRELGALGLAQRPSPVRRVRELWDNGAEEKLKACGAVAVDLDAMPGLWEQLSSLCRAKLADRSEVAMPCDKEPLSTCWQIFSGLAAEVLRCFRLMELKAIQELRLMRLSTDLEVDNGGLMPDNRREVSFRIFVPVDGRSGPEATLNLHTKDQEVALSYAITAYKAFVWWSRQSFYQVLGGDGYFAICGWAAILQKPDVS